MCPPTNVFLPSEHFPRPELISILLTVVFCFVIFKNVSAKYMYAWLKLVQYTKVTSFCPLILTFC